MIEKVAAPVWVALGVGLVLVMWSFRANVRAAAQKTNRFGRLLRVGLLYVGVLGATTGCSACGGKDAQDSGLDTAAIIVENADRPVAQTEAWKRFVSLWDECMPIVERKMGDYPFTSIGRDSLLQRLDATMSDIEALATDGQLSLKQAELLKSAVGDLRNDVRGFRPVEDKSFTCYIAAEMPSRVSSRRLHERLPLIQDLVARGDLDTAVIAALLKSVEREVRVIEDERDRNPRHIAAYPHTPAETVAVEARQAISRIREMLSDSGHVSQE